MNIVNVILEQNNYISRKYLMVKSRCHIIDNGIISITIDGAELFT